MTMRKRIAMLGVSAVLSAAVAGCGGAGASSPAEIVTAAAKAAGSDRVQSALFLFKGDKPVFTSVNVVKDGQILSMVNDDGGVEHNDTLPVLPMGTVQASDFPVAEATEVIQGVTCPDGTVYARVSIMPSGKSWAQSMCETNGGAPAAQRLDGKPVEDLVAIDNPDALDTFLAEARTVFGDSAQVRQINLLTGVQLGVAPTMSVTADVEGCPVTVVRGLKVAQEAPLGLGGAVLNCEETTEGEPFSLNEITGEALAKAMSGGIRSIGGSLMGATLIAGSDGKPVLEIVSTQRGAMIRIDLDGNPVHL